MLPAGSKLISPCATDAGDGNREDLANRDNAGFLLDRAEPGDEPAK